MIDGQVVVFDHLDGMYSYCYLESDPSKLIHLSAVTPLKKVGDYYEIDEAGEMPKFAGPMRKEKI